MEKILIGKIVNVVGLKGELKVYSYSDKDGFEGLKHIYVKGKKTMDKMDEYDVEGSRNQKNMVVLKLKGVDDRNAAEALKERELYIGEEDLRELPEDTFYIRDLMGMQVLDYETGDTIGELVDVLQNSAQDNYVIKTLKGQEILLPAVEEFVKSVSLEERTVKVKLIPGFIDEALEV